MIEAAFSVPRMLTSSMGWCWAWPSVLLLHEPVMQMCEMTWASWYVELYDSTRVSHLITTECCYKLWILDGSLHIDPSGKPNLLDISNEVRVHASSSYKLSRFKLKFVFFSLACTGVSQALEVTFSWEQETAVLFCSTFKTEELKAAGAGISFFNITLVCCQYNQHYVTISTDICLLSAGLFSSPRTFCYLQPMIDID